MWGESGRMRTFEKLGSHVLGPRRTPAAAHSPYRCVQVRVGVRDEVRLGAKPKKDTAHQGWFLCH